MARFGTPPQGRDPLAYVDSRLCSVPTIDSNRDPTVNDANYPIQTIWRNQNTFRECMLVGFTGGQAIWRCFTGGEGSILELRGDDSILIQPNSGIIDIQGETVANSTNTKPVYFNGATANTGKIQVQLGTTVSPTPADNTKSGLLCANINQFDIDATSGMLTLKGDSTNPALTKLAVDFNTGPGTDPVVPDANAQISLYGNVVTNGTNASSPVATHSRAVNQSHIDVQLSTAVAPTPANPDDVGLISVDNQYFSVSGNGFMTVKNSLIGSPAGTTYNLGINYSSPTFKITSADGTALSATNPGFVVLASKVNPGYRVVHTITSDISFDDDSGTSDIIGNTFGTTAGTLWGETMPMFIYAVAEDLDASATFMISRIPHLYTSPAASKIAKSGSAVATTQGSFFAIDSGVTVADFDSNPCRVVGSFTIRKNDGPNDDWTVQALTERDGFGLFQDGVRFFFPGNQNGSTSTALSSSNGADTIPTFLQTAAAYLIQKTGLVSYVWNFDNITVSGSGSGALRFHVPFVTYFQSVRQTQGTISWLNNGASTYVTGLGISTNDLTYFEILPSGTSVVKLRPGSWTTDKKNGGFMVNYYARIE